MKAVQASGGWATRPVF